MKIIECPICDATQDATREHCQYCGARRVFLAGHSFEPCKTRETRQNENRVELVRAFRSDLAFSVAH